MHGGYGFFGVNVGSFFDFGKGGWMLDAWCWETRTAGVKIILPGKPVSPSAL